MGEWYPTLLGNKLSHANSEHVFGNEFNDSRYVAKVCKNAHEIILTDSSEYAHCSFRFC